MLSACTAGLLDDDAHLHVLNLKLSGFVIMPVIFFVTRHHTSKDNRLHVNHKWTKHMGNSVLHKDL